MEELELPELTTQQIETLCSTAENAARKHILSKVTSKGVDRVNVSVEAEGLKPLNLSIDVDLALAVQEKGTEASSLADEAVKEAFKAAENYLRTLK